MNYLPQKPRRRQLTHDRLLAQSAVITADSTGESGVASRELLANQNIRNEGVVGHVTIMRTILSWLGMPFSYLLTCKRHVFLE